MKKCSIIIPYYQRKKLLLNTLKSLSVQVGILSEDYEVLVMNDGDSEFVENDIQELKKNLDRRAILTSLFPI